MRIGLVALLACTIIAGSSPAAPAPADDACHAALQARVKACAAACIERAKAAVDPEVRGRILGYGCTTNCTKLEMFNGNTCPR